MSNQEADALYSWVDRETRHLDLVASWESLLSTYEVMKFVDPISDTVRLGEFKWIIKEMNKFLTRMRAKLMKCKTIDAMVEELRLSITPQGKVILENRQALAYQKLRQQWILQNMAALETTMEQMTQIEEANNGPDGEPSDDWQS